MNLKLRRPLLGVLGAVAAYGVGFSVTEVFASTSEVAAAGVESIAATFSSDEVVSNTSYKTYSDNDWIVTLGGNNKSVGTNSGNRSKLGLTGSYAKYVPASNPSLASMTTAVIYRGSLEDIGRVEVSWDGGKGTNRGGLYLVHSEANDVFEQIGQLDITGTTSYSFDLDQTYSGYFAVVWQDSSSSGDYRFDNVVIDFVSFDSSAEVVPVSAIEIVSSSDTVYEGDKIQLSAVVTPDDATYKEVEWSLDNYEIADIDETGVLNAISEGTVVVTASATDDSGVIGQKEIKILHSDAIIYRFGQHEAFAGWNTEYKARELKFADSTGDLFTASFSSADKQTSNITDMPVSKQGTLTITSSKDMLGIEFGFEQWTTKTQRLTLTVDSHSQSMTFPDDGITISYKSESPFKQAIVSATSDNQIGWEYVKITWAPETSSNAEAFAETFLEEQLCDGGLNAPGIGTWNTLADLYGESLADEEKALFASAVSNEEGTLIEQCVARYDYIVGKYGSDTYQDFMGRSPEPLNYGISINKRMSEEAPAWICALTLLAATLVLGGAFIARRRKESR